jgi:hypothetical protein
MPVEKQEHRNKQWENEYTPTRILESYDVPLANNKRKLTCKLNPDLPRKIPDGTYFETGSWQRISQILHTEHILCSRSSQP